MLFKWPSISQVLRYFPSLKGFCCTELQNIWMLICWGCFKMAHAEKIGDSPLGRSKIICSVLFIWTEMHWIWITIPMLWRPHLIENRCIVFSRLPLYSLKGRRKDVSSVAILWQQPRKWINRLKQQVKRICRPDTVWLFKWKEVNRILKEYIFIYNSVSFSFFHRHLKSTEWP